MTSLLAAYPRVQRKRVLLRLAKGDQVVLNSIELAMTNRKSKCEARVSLWIKWPDGCEMHLLSAIAVRGIEIINMGMSCLCQGPQKLFIRSEGAAVAVQLRGYNMNRGTA